MSRGDYKYYSSDGLLRSRYRDIIINEEWEYVPWSDKPQKMLKVDVGPDPPILAPRWTAEDYICLGLVLSIIGLPFVRWIFGV